MKKDLRFLCGFRGPVIEGRLIRRYKRFLADIEIPALNTKVTAHCPNTGSMMGLTTPGNRVLLTKSEKLERKLPYTLECIKSGKTWVCINTLEANRLTGILLDNKLFRGLRNYSTVKSECKYDNHTRFDFFLSGGKQSGHGTYVEVKSVTLMRKSGLAEFPDAVTERGHKHLQRLMEATARGYGAILIYLSMRGDCRHFAPAADIDPTYSNLFNQALNERVKILTPCITVRKNGYFLKSGQLTLTATGGS